MSSESELKKKLDYYKQKNLMAKKEYELKQEIKEQKSMLKEYRPNLFTKIVDRIKEVFE